MTSNASVVQNPVLRGFCPDPSMIRVGDDYYIACSTFEWWPGVKLFHSRDLAHWQQLPSPLRRTSQLDMRGAPVNCGVWAPALSYHAGRFFLVFTDVKTQRRPYYHTHNYVVWTDDITGEWSEPVYLNSTGFDPSLFHEGDKKYLINMRNGFKGILLQEYDHAQRKLVGPVHEIFKGTELGFTEGPHLFRRGEYYYLVVAEGGTGYGHAVTVARARNLTGPYELDPQYPMLTSRDNAWLRLQKAGHSSFVETQHGTWVMAHLCARPVLGKSLTGRETALQPVVWEDDWPRVAGGGHAPLDAFVVTGLPDEATQFVAEQPPEHDDFSRGLGEFYSSMRVPLGEDARVEAGVLTLTGRESMFSCYRVTLLARRQQESRCTAETSMRFAPTMGEHAAGLAYLYNNDNFYLLIKTCDDNGGELLRLARSKKGANWEMLAEIALARHDDIRLGAENVATTVRFSFALDDGAWQSIGGECDSGFLSDEDAPGFTGAHFALYCHDVSGGGKQAQFTYFAVKALPEDAV